MKRVITLYKNSYSGLSPATWWLSLVMLINRSGTMVIPFMSLYLTQALHYTIAQAGAIMGICGVGAICGGMLGGWLTDKFGFYYIQLGTLICGGILFFILGQMTSFMGIAVCIFILALINDAFRPANAAAIAQYSNEHNRTRAYSFNRLSVNLGWAAGSVLGGIIASHNYHMLFWIDGLTNIAAAMLLRSVLAPSRNSQTPERKKAVSVTTGSPAWRDIMFVAFIGLTVLFGCTFFQIFTVLPVFFKEKLSLSPAFIGMLMALNGLLIVAFEMALVFTLEQRRKHVRFMGIGILLVALSFVVFNLLPGRVPVAIISTLLLSLGEMLAMPFMNSFWIKRTDPGNRGQYAGMYTVAWSVAQVIGNISGTQVVQHYGFATLWWIIGALGIVTAAGFYQLKDKTPAPSAPAAE